MVQNNPRFINFSRYLTLHPNHRVELRRSVLALQHETLWVCYLKHTFEILDTKVLA